MCRSLFSFFIKRITGESLLSVVIVRGVRAEAGIVRVLLCKCREAGKKLFQKVFCRDVRRENAEIPPGVLRKDKVHPGAAGYFRALMKSAERRKA